ncbi:hypothetical protein Tco_1363942 [Tanacetum coccineum]
MAAKSTIPQLVDKKGGSYATIAPKLDPRKFNKWKKRILCYLAGMEPYYIRCIKDGLFQPKTAEGAIKPESQWTQDERRVVIQDQRLKSIIMSCLPDDIMKAKPSESLSRTYTRYKTLLNELSNDGVNLSKHKINVGFVNSLPKKWLTFSQGLRNTNHTQTLDIVDIYGRFVYEDNLIQRRYSDTKKALITTPSTTPISTDFFSNHVVQDFQENSDDEVDKRTMSNFSSVSKAFQPKFTPKLIQSSQQTQNSQLEPKIQKDYKTEYKKMKSKPALLEASASTS